MEVRLYRSLATHVGNGSLDFLVVQKKENTLVKRASMAYHAQKNQVIDCQWSHESLV